MTYGRKGYEMSEKRFRPSADIIVTNVLSIWDSEKCKHFNQEQILDLLNKLSDENKLLKSTNIEQFEQIQELQNENEQLQTQLMIYYKYNDSKKEREYAVEEIIDLFNNLNNKNERLSTKCRQLESENEQLRNSIRDFLEEADLFSENAIDHDIVAFREMMKFDNKDAFAIAYAISELKKVVK